MNEPQTLLTGKRYTSAVHTDIRAHWPNLAAENERRRIERMTANVSRAKVESTEREEVLVCK